MVLPIQYNPISLGNVQVEYGGTNPIGINEYYGQGNAPASGQISLGDFHQTIGSGTAPVTTNLLFELDARNSSSWPGSGATWFDTTSNSRDFALINGPTGGTNSVVFDGINDHAEIANGAWIPSGTAARTVEFYVKMHTWRTNQVAFLFSKTSPSNQAGNFGLEESSGNVYLGLSTQGGGTFNNNITSQYQLSNPSNYLNSFHQYAFTYDGSIVRIYLDGTLVWTSSANQNLHSNSAVQRMMCFDPSNGSFSWNVDGEIAISRLYNTALSAAQISTNYSNCVTGAGPVTPTAATLTFSPSSHSGSTFTGTFSFDKNVGDFTTGDVTVTGGSKGTFTKVTGSEYTLLLTPTTTSSTVSVSVPANSAYTAGNLGHNSISLSLAYAPFVTGNLVCRVDANNNNSYNGSGTTWTDLSTAGNNVTLVNGPTFNSSGGVEYFSFDGSNDYGEVTRMISTNFTLAAWIRTNSHTGSGAGSRFRFWRGHGIIDTEWFGGGDFGLVVLNGSAGFGVGDNATIWSSPSTHPVTDGSWHYLVATRNASTGEIILYVDGSQAAQNSTSGGTNALTDTSTIRIGSTWSGARYYNGDIAEVHIYDDVLTSSEVSTNYGSGGY